VRTVLAKELIRIAGAGISGLTCAINLCIEGYKVIVFEKRDEVGARFNCDFQGLENWSSAEDALTTLAKMNIQTNFYYKGFRETALIDHSLKKYTITSTDDRFGVYMLKRGREVDCLDQSLKKQAIASGVEIEFNAKNKETYTDVIATGPRYPSGIVYGIKGTADHDDVTALLFDDIGAPKGYAYMAILDGQVTLASVMMRDFTTARERFSGVRDHFCRLYNLDIKEPKQFSGYGNFFLKRTYCDHGKFYIGESAGLQDYLLGFGMRHAFVSGYLASQSIIHGLDYNTLLKTTVLPLIKSSLVNRFSYEKIGNLGYEKLLKKWSSSTDPLKHLRTWYNYTVLKRFLYPVACKSLHVRKL